MRIMYISRRFEENICATMHYRSIKAIFGEENVITVDLSMVSKRSGKNIITYQSPTILGKMIQRLAFYPRWLTRRIIKDISDKIKQLGIEKVYIDEGFFGILTRHIKRIYPNIIVVTFYHDISKVLYTERLREKGIVYIYDYISVLRGERLNVKYSDYNLVLNDRDASLFLKCYKKKPEAYLPMGVAEPDLSDFCASEFKFARDHGERYLVFIGTYYEPNLRGLRWFVDQVFVKVPQNFHLVVVGRNLEKLASEYLNDRIHIIGGVNSLAPYYNNADIVVGPVLGGGGMKQKTAEAFAYGRCFLGTRESIQGYEKELMTKHNGHRVVFASDSPDELIQAVREIEKNGLFDFIPELNCAYERYYSQKSLISVLRSILA